MVLWRRCFATYCMLNICLCQDAEESSSEERPITTHLTSPNTQAPDLTRLHQRRICARSLDGETSREIEDDPRASPFSYIVSPLTGFGQVIVNPTAYFMNVSEYIKEVAQEPSPSSSAHPTPEVISPSHLRDLEVPSDVESTKSTSSKEPLTGTYYPDWNADILPPEKVDYEKYDILYYAFGVPNENCGLDFTQDDSLDILDKLVKLAHAHGTKVVLSVGGWSGSKYFSSVVKNSSTREKFVKTLKETLTTHDLDGIDIDWEYPGQAQVQDNIASPQDTQALLDFFRLLRSALGSRKLISAAVTDFTFVDSNGKRMKDVSEFGKVLDYVLIMNYDVTGSSTRPGPNAPFSDKCNDSSQPGADMESAIKTWTKAGFPISKIIMGLPAYGYINWSSASSLVHRKRSIDGGEGRLMTRYEQYLVQSQRRISRRQSNSGCSSSPGTNCTDQAQTPAMINSTSSNLSTTPNQPAQNTSSPANSTVMRSAAVAGDGNLNSYSGPQIQFTDLFTYGVIGVNSSDTSGNITGLNGYTIAWDDCTSTPFVYNQARNTVVTYDDANSTGIKSAYALKSGIAGVGFWDITGDHELMLINSARKQLGKK